MGYECSFPACKNRATRYESVPLLPSVELVGLSDYATIRTFCDSHYGEDECPRHVASGQDSKVCGRCGIHIDSLRPE